MDLPLLLLTLSYFALNCVFYLLVNWFYLAAFTPHAASSASVRNACPRAYSFAMASVSGSTTVPYLVGQADTMNRCRDRNENGSTGGVKHGTGGVAA